MRWQLSIWKRPFSLLLILILFGFGLRLAGLNSQSLWWDELKTWERTLIPLSEMITGLLNIRDQVPFYFLLIRFWANLGADAFTLRLFSVFVGTATVPLIFQIGRQLKDAQTGLLAAFLLAISPFHIWYSQEARMYTLLPVLLLSAHLFLMTALKRQKQIRWWVLYGLFMTAAIFTHYFSFLVVLAHYIFFVLHMRQIKAQTGRWFVTMLGVGIAFAPWVWLILTRTDGYGTAVPTWISPINWWEPFLTLQLFSTGFGLSPYWISFLGTILFLVGLVASSQFVRREGKEDVERPLPIKTLHSRLLFLWLTFPILIVLLVSLDYPIINKGSLSIYHDRYLIITLPPLLLLVAQGWQSQRLPTQFRQLAILVITVLSLFSLSQQYQNPAFARNDWRAVFALIDAAKTDEQLLIGHRDLLLPVTYYGNKQISFVQIPPPETDERTPSFDSAMAQQLGSASANNSMVWHAEPFYNFDPHGSPAERNALVANVDETVTQSWLIEQFTLVEKFYFPGIRLTLYDSSAQTHE